MNKEVLIHVRGLQMMDADGDAEPIEIVVPGQYYFRNGSHYLRYEEILEDFPEPTVNYIKMSPKGKRRRPEHESGLCPGYEPGACGRLLSGDSGTAKRL